MLHRAQLDFKGRRLFCLKISVSSFSTECALAHSESADRAALPWLKKQSAEGRSRRRI